MIVTKIIGGLGNQMFQYAVARTLASIHNTALKLDISSYKSYKLRKYELDNFNINAEIASREEIDKFTNQPRNPFQKALFAFLPQLQGRSRFYYEEKFYHFDSEVLNLPNNVYLNGYWQSEKYFIEIQDIIRREFTVKHHPDKYNLSLIKQINSTDSVGVHIRRGDFVTDENTKSLHGLYEMDYLQKAIFLMIGKIASVHFYIFSDDIDWVRNNIKIEYPMTFIDNNIGKKDYEDLRLMSSCKNNIIVNSTFGWWGAWLNKNKSKIVITPKNWYKNGPIDTQDLIPESWIRI